LSRGIEAHGELTYGELDQLVQLRDIFRRRIAEGEWHPKGQHADTILTMIGRISRMTFIINILMNFGMDVLYGDEISGRNWHVRNHRTV
jgi:hypothetical protein